MDMSLLEAHCECINNYYIPSKGHPAIVRAVSNYICSRPLGSLSQISFNTFSDVKYYTMNSSIHSGHSIKKKKNQ